MRRGKVGCLLLQEEKTQISASGGHLQSPHLHGVGWGGYGNVGTAPEPACPALSPEGRGSGFSAVLGCDLVVFFRTVPPFMGRHQKGAEQWEDVPLLYVVDESRQGQKEKEGKRKIPDASWNWCPWGCLRQAGDPAGGILQWAHGVKKEYLSSCAAVTSRNPGRVPLVLCSNRVVPSR